MLSLTVLMNTNHTSTELDDFEVFDLRDGLNVVAYSVMSSSKFGYEIKDFIAKLSPSSAKLSLISLNKQGPEKYREHRNVITRKADSWQEGKSLYREEPGR